MPLLFADVWLLIEVKDSLRGVWDHYQDDFWWMIPIDSGWMEFKADCNYLYRWSFHATLQNVHAIWLIRNSCFYLPIVSGFLFQLPLLVITWGLLPISLAADFIIMLLYYCYLCLYSNFISFLLISFFLCLIVHFLPVMFQWSFNFL